MDTEAPGRFGFFMRRCKEKVMQVMQRLIHAAAVPQKKPTHREWVGFDISRRN